MDGIHVAPIQRDAIHSTTQKSKGNQINTHDIDIELPPLPEARIVSYQTDSTMRSMELRTYSDQDMQEYARAAIDSVMRKESKQ